MSGIKLVPPRAGKTPNYYLRGTHQGVTVNQTTGTPNRAEAGKIRKALISEINAGVFTPRSALTFAEAGISYINAGNEDRFLTALNRHFGNMPVSMIDQAAIDNAAVTIYPKASPATRNRQVYTPMSAILKHAKVDFKLRRPKGAQGEEKTDWLRKWQAFAILKAAKEKDAEFGVFIATLLYTGLRLSEALHLKISDLHIDEAYAYVPKTKNEEPRALHLPPVLVAELRAHPRGLDRAGETVFRFRKNGRLYNLKNEVQTATKIKFDFHMFRHTWASWMRRYAKLDTKGLMATGAWKDEKSAARYQHVVVSEEMLRTNLLPTMESGEKAVDLDE